MLIRSPSKVILFGEHIIVYKNSSAVITSLGLYMNAKSSAPLNSSFNVIFTSTSFDLDITFDIKEAIKAYEKAKKIREEYLVSGDIKDLKSFIHTNGNFFRIIVGFIYLKYPNIKPLKIVFDTKVPLGSGLGTSSSIAATMISLILRENNIKYSSKDLFDLTKEVEDFAHGSSSGIDPACVINGGLLSYEHKKDGSKSINKIKKDDKWTSGLYLVDTGHPKESTSEMVSVSRKFKEKNEKRFNEILDNINKISREFIDSDTPDMIRLINDNGLLLEEMGVVNEKVMEFCEEIRENGGGAKLSGAGGRLQGSGMVLIKFNDLRVLDKLLKKYNFKLIKAKFQVKGIN